MQEHALFGRCRAGSLPGTGPGERLEALTLALGVVFVLAFTGIALARLFYPYEVSWMESATYQMMLQRLQGRSIYVPPSLFYTPCLYPPLYFDASAELARLLGLAATISFLPMRLLSLTASSALFVLTCVLVRRKGASVRWSVALGSIFLATYGRFECWQDNSRVDAVYCFWLVAATAFLLEGRGLRSALLAGAAFGMAILTKQPAAVLMVLTAIQVAVAERSRRRASFAATAAALTVVGYLAFTGELGNPLLYHYLFTVPASHPLQGQRFFKGLLFLPVTVPILCVLGWPTTAAGDGEDHEAMARRRPWSITFILWFLVTVFLQCKRGASINFFLPLIPVAILAAVEGTSDSRGTRDERGGTRRSLSRLLPFFPAIQLLFLVYDPRPFVPTTEDRRGAAALVSRLGELDGAVWFPAFPSYAALAGKPWFAQEVPLADLAESHPDLVRRSLTREIGNGTFGALIIPRGTPFIDEVALRPYRLESLPVADTHFLGTLHAHHVSTGVVVAPAPPSLPQATEP